MARKINEVLSEKPSVEEIILDIGICCSCNHPQAIEARKKALDYIEKNRQEGVNSIEKNKEKS
jgi:hypothetical protein